MNHLILVLFVCFYQPVRCKWYSSNPFHDCDLHFLMGGNVSQFPPWLHERITRHNPYTPQLIGEFVLNADSHKPVRLNVASIPQNIYRFRTLVVFVDLGKSIKLVKHIYLLLAILRCSPPAQYIFARVANPYRSRGSYEGYHYGISSSKLVLFGSRSHEWVNIPCLPCRQSTLKLKPGFNLLREIEIMFLGKRFVVRGLGDTGFATVLVTYGSGNLIVPLLNSGYRKLAEAGLTEIWLCAYWQSVRLNNIRKQWKHLYKQYSAQVNSGVAFKQEFQKWAPVSVEVVKYMFAVCGVLLSGAGLMFLVEGRRKGGFVCGIIITTAIFFRRFSKPKLTCKTCCRKPHGRPVLQEPPVQAQFDDGDSLIIYI